MANTKSLEHAVKRRVKQKLGRAIQRDYLIEEGDCIPVGLSGRKDSMVLLETLAGRLKIHPFTNPLTVLHIGHKTQPYTIDSEYFRSFAEGQQIPFSYPLVNVDPSVLHNHNLCYKCSWNRRKALFPGTQASGFNQLAMGHPMDDAIQTILRYMTLESGISSMPPALPMFENKWMIIRPLSLQTGGEVKELAAQKSYKWEIKTSLYEKDSKRSETKEPINQLEQLIPNVKLNRYASVRSPGYEYLPNEKY